MMMIRIIKSTIHSFISIDYYSKAMHHSSSSSCAHAILVHELKQNRRVGDFFSPANFRLQHVLCVCLLLYNIIDNTTVARVQVLGAGATAT